jgi:hypothetical protein
MGEPRERGRKFDASLAFSPLEIWIANEFRIKGKISPKSRTARWRKLGAFPHARLVLRLAREEQSSADALENGCMTFGEFVRSSRTDRQVAPIADARVRSGLMLFFLVVPFDSALAWRMFMGES